MKCLNFLCFLRLFAVMAVWLTLAVSAKAQMAPQTIRLSAGWNAVWLEVEPIYDSGGDAGYRKRVADVFTNPAIQVVATPKERAGTAEYFGSDPDTAGLFNQDEWEQWKRVDPAGANNLTLITGNRPYLLRVAAGTVPFSVVLTGRARFFRPTWVPDRFNLVGFGLEGTATFADFFGPSGTKHPVSRIFRLNPAGTWETVAGSQPMVANEAYWIFASGASNYMGPVAVDFDLASAGVLNFGDPSDAVPVGPGTPLSLDLKALVFTNLRAAGGTSAVPGLELITADAGPGRLGLYVVRPATDRLAYERGNEVDTTAGDGVGAALEETVVARTSATLTLGAERAWDAGLSGRTNLYRLRTGAGSAFWLPVSAVRNGLTAAADLIPQGSAGVAGLWVGEVSLTATTSIVVAGTPVQPAAGTAAVRILVHSDSAGALRLLSQVTLMQTRTADATIPPSPVLVVNPAKIPFFEGIRERNGKRAGIRMESVSYDMPRDTSTAAQAGGTGDLLDMIVAESMNPVTLWVEGRGTYPDRGAVTPSAISSYLQFRRIRPPALKERYVFTLPLDGAIGAGKTLLTRAGTLVLDPFHRSNPFRHAFHQDEGKGPQIVREMKVVLDADQPNPSLLRGNYEETIANLIKTKLVLTGTIELRRVSPVAVLDAAP